MSMSARYPLETEGFRATIGLLSRFPQGHAFRVIRPPAPVLASRRHAIFSPAMPGHFLDLSFDELLAWLAQRGVPKYRAAQIRRWVFEKRAASFDDMSDLP